MALRFGGDVEFVLVYIREAHALDGDWPILDGPLVEEPRSLEERIDVARACVTDLGMLGMTAVVDAMDDGAARAYAGLPDRLYLVGADGRIVYAGGRGPFGFAPDELERAIVDLLATDDDDPPEPVVTAPDRS